MSKRKPPFIGIGSVASLADIEFLTDVLPGQVGKLAPGTRDPARRHDAPVPQMEPHSNDPS